MRFRVCLPYTMIYFCLLFVASGMYYSNYVMVILNLALALFWLREFIKSAKFYRLNDEFKRIIKEAQKRVESGAPAEELLEMAKDRLDKMGRL